MNIKLRARRVDLKSIVMSIFYLDVSTTMHRRQQAVQGNYFISNQFLINNKIISLYSLLTVVETSK